MFREDQLACLDSSCLEENEDGTCAACDEANGFYFSPTSQECVYCSEETTYLNINVCIECGSFCTSCGESGCEACANGYYLNTSG